MTPGFFSLVGVAGIAAALLATSRVGPAGNQPRAVSATQPPLCAQGTGTADFVPIEHGVTSALGFSIPARHSVAFVVPAAPGTGYGWTLGRGPDAAVVEPVGSWLLPAEKTTPGMSRKEIWVFRGVRPGMTDFTLVYSRPLAHLTAPAKTLTIWVKVVGNQPALPGC
jgi:predicted secreted protein